MISNTNAENTDGIMPGQCDMVIRLLPPGTGNLVSGFKIFKDLEEYNPVESYKYIQKKNNDIYTASFTIAPKKKDGSIHSFEILKPIVEGYVCVGETSNMRLDYVYQSSNLKDANINYKLSLNNYNYNINGSSKILQGKEDKFEIELGKNSNGKTFKDIFSSASNRDSREYVKASLDYFIVDSEGKQTATSKIAFYMNYDDDCRGYPTTAGKEAGDKKEETKVETDKTENPIIPFDK